MMIELVEKVGRSAGAVDTLTLPYERRQKSRQRVRLDNGCEAAILLPIGTTLDDGDCLRALDGTCVEVNASLEEVTTLRTDNPMLLARA